MYIEIQITSSILRSYGDNEGGNTDNKLSICSGSCSQLGTLYPLENDLVK